MREREQRAGDTPAAGLAAELDAGLERARSENVQLRMRGIAVWTAIVFHATAGAAAPGAEALHRDVLRLTRQLKPATTGDADSN